MERYMLRSTEILFGMLTALLAARRIVKLKNLWHIQAFLVLRMAITSISITY